MRSTRRGRRRAGLAAAATAAGLCAACGARLSPAQHGVFDAPYRTSTAAGQLPIGTAGPVPAVAAASAALPVGPPGPAVSVPAGGSRAPAATTSTDVRSAAVPGSRPPTRGAGVRAAPSYGIDAASGSISIDPAICAKPAVGNGISATEIDLGNVSTLTGPIPGIFLGAVHGVQAFATYVNSLGGICDRKLVIKSADDNLQVSQNAAATQQLADQVFAFVGSFSADDQGGAQVLKADGVPDVGQALSKDRFDLPNSFAPEPIAGWNVAPYLLFKKLQPEASQHMAILGANQPVGHAEYLAQKQAMLNAGMKIVYDDPNIEATQNDFSSDAQAMKAAGAQGIAWASTAGVMANTAKAIQNAGISPFPLATWGTTAYDQTFLQQAGSSAEGSILELQEAMYQGEDSAAVPMIATFTKWYQALYHEAPDEYAMYSWMSGLLFIEGLDRGGALDGKALLAGLKRVTSFDAGGMVAPNNPAGKKPPTCYLIVDVKGGRFVRDPSDPRTGFNCQFAPNYYYTGG